MKLRIDLNCDMGEHDAGDEHAARRDASILPLVSSASISCGAHAGEESVIADTIRRAAAAGTAVGAHPGFADREHFGRRELGVDAAGVHLLMSDQLRAFLRIAASVGAAVTHVKPHGALYNMAARDPVVARAVANAVREIDPRLILYGLAGSELVRAGRSAGLVVAEEAFGDRMYESDGSLTPRSIEGSVVDDAERVAARVVRMATRGVVRTRQGTDHELTPDTICVHSDSPNALSSIGMIRAALEQAGIDIVSPAAA